MLAPVLTTLRTNNMYNSVTKEIGGSNIPHCLLVANKNELYDQAINQFGNTAVVFGGSYLLSRLISKVFTALNPGTFVNKACSDAVSQKWFVLGKSFAIYSLIAGYVLSSPFLRNWITSKRTKSGNYAEMVGMAKGKNSREETVKRLAKEAEYKKKFQRLLGIGWGGTLGILALTQALIRKKPHFGKGFEFIQRHLSLPNGDYKKLKDLPLYLFWAIPAYTGLYVASRDKLEKKEIIYRAGGFGLAFIVLPRTLEKYVDKKIGDKTFKHVGSGKNLAFLFQLLSGILFYTSIPTIVNLVKRRERAQEYGLTTGGTTQRTFLFAPKKKLNTSS